MKKIKIINTIILLIFLTSFLTACSDNANIENRNVNSEDAIYLNTNNYSKYVTICIDKIESVKNSSLPGYSMKSNVTVTRKNGYFYSTIKLEFDGDYGENIYFFYLDKKSSQSMEIKHHGANQYSNLILTKISGSATPE